MVGITQKSMFNLYFHFGPFTKNSLNFIVLKEKIKSIVLDTHILISS